MGNYLRVESVKIQKFIALFCFLFLIQNTIFSQCPPPANAGQNQTISCNGSIQIGTAPTTPPPAPMAANGCSSAAGMIVNPAGGAYINSVSTTGGLTTNINNMNTLVDGSNPSNTYIAFNRWYSDYTSKFVDTKQSGSFVLNLEGNKGATGSNPPTFSFRIWIDWNNDGSFDNVAGSELVYTTATSSSNPFTFSNIVINVPANAAIATVRMRIRVKYGAPFVASDASCTKSNPNGWPGQGNYDHTSEVEDYAVKIGPGDGGANSGNYTYAWTPANSLDNPSSATPNASPATTTTYTVTVTDPVNNCSSTSQVTVTVNPNVTPTFTNPGPICKGATLSLPTSSTNTPPITGTWSPAPNNQTTTTYTFTPDAGQCGTTTTMTVVIDQLPTPIINTNGATCTADGKSTITNYNSNLTYTFTPAGPSINPNGEIINAVTGTSYTVSSSNGTTCNSQQSTPFVNAPMQNTLPAPATTTTQPDCSTDGTASITNYSSNYTYVFTPAGPTVNTNGTISNLTFGTSYTVTASTNGGSCQSQPSTPFSVAGKLSKPTVSIKGNSTICSGGITNLVLESPQQGATLTWTTSATGNITGYSNGSGTTILQTLTGADNSSVTYVVTPTLNGCIGDSVSFTVSISKGNLDAAFTPSPQQITPYNSTVHFTNLSQGATAYLWNFGENNATSNLKDPTYTYKGESEQNYSVILIASDNKGCKDTATVIVKMVDDVVFFVPNAFTPDGDEFNNTFKPVFAQGFDAYEYELLIFDRWGEIIFESHNVTYGWDGTYLGKMCPDGTYVWRISVKKKEQVERIQKSGHITLLK